MKRLIKSNSNVIQLKNLFVCKLLIYVFILVSFLACSQQTKASLNQQIEELINSENLIKDKYGRIVFFKSELCIEKECESYFEDFKNQVQFYSKNEIFMYNLGGYVEIDSIDDNSIQYKKVNWN